MERHVYEHFRHEGMPVQNPVAVATVLHGEQELAQYGFWVMPREQIEDMCTLRSAQLANTSTMDPELLNYAVRIVCGDREYWFRYDPDRLIFKETYATEETETDEHRAPCLD